MKVGFRIPSLSKRIESRTSGKRYVRNSLGLKASRGYGWVTNPKKHAFNKVYRKTTTGCMVTLLLLAGLLFSITLQYYIIF